eukprot:7010591-Pyramimonas_sp.AAC.1
MTATGPEESASHGGSPLSVGPARGKAKNTCDETRGRHSHKTRLSGLRQLLSYAQQYRKRNGKV